MRRDSLGDRMKDYYENRSKAYLTRRSNVIIRIDGQHFHTTTKGFDKPYDEHMIKVMQLTTKYLCENIEGCKFGYVQSDEISLLLTDYDTLNTDAWFDYSIQKMCSIAASMATFAFYKFFNEEFNNIEDCNEYAFNAYKKVINNGATFDARCFNIPREEVTNYFIWRQQDATRNSIQGLGQKHFSQKELQSKTCNDIQEMLFKNKGINWNDEPIVHKRGTACYRKEQEINNTIRYVWNIDYEMPILTQDRDYIEKLLPIA